MTALVGFLLVVASIFLFAWSVVAFRDPRRPAWREKYLVLELLACLAVALLTFGVALELKFAFQFEGAAAWALGLASLAAPAAVYATAWRLLGVNAKLAAFAAAEEAAPSAPPVVPLRKRAGG